MAGLTETTRQYASFFHTALRSVGRNKLRSFLSVLGVVFGVMAVMTIICVGQGARDEALRRVEELGTRNIYLRQLSLTPEQRAAAGSLQNQGLAREDMERILRAEITIEQAAGLKELHVPLIGTLHQMAPQIVSCTANYADLLGLKTDSGRFIRQSDVDRGRLVCVLGHDVAEKLGKDGRPGGHLRIGSQVFTIAGRLAAMRGRGSAPGTVSVRNHNEMIFLPSGSRHWLAKTDGPGGRSGADNAAFSEIIIEVADTASVIPSAAIIRRIMNQGGDTRPGYQMVVPLALLHQAHQTNETFNRFLTAIAGISLLVGGIGIMNIMLASISERKREIGIRRAVGATRVHIVAQFLAESTLLTLSGGAIGVVLGAGAALAISVSAPWHASLTPSAIGIPLGMSLAVGLFFGLYPAWQAARLDPIQALKYE